MKFRDFSWTSDCHSSYDINLQTKRVISHEIFNKIIANNVYWKCMVFHLNILRIKTIKKSTTKTILQIYIFLISNTFISNTRLKLTKNETKAKQHPEAELLIKMFKKQVFLFQWNYMINCNENDNDNGTIDHINKT